MTFSDFEKREHAKRVAHFVKVINMLDRKPDMMECMAIFGICERDAKPIFDDAVAQVAGEAA